MSFDGRNPCDDIRECDCPAKRRKNKYASDGFTILAQRPFFVQFSQGDLGLGGRQRLDATFTGLAFAVREIGHVEHYTGCKLSDQKWPTREGAGQAETLSGAAGNGQGITADSMRKMVCHQYKASN